MAFLKHTALLFVAMAVMLSARAAESGATGVIKGRISNAGTGQYLVKAVVSLEGGDIVKGRNIQATTEEDGYYRISGLAAGTYTISANYVGLDIETHTVSIAEGEEKTMNFELSSDVYVLGQFTVAAEREGSAKALQDQRQSDNQKNIVAADSFGDLVDGNVGELMKNLPGITIDYAGEDAGAMRIRGMDPSTANVTLNGNAMANFGSSDANSRSGDSRSFSLRDFPVQNIEVIEVSFVPTAAQPANSMGGSVNFVTKSAFDQKGRRLRFDDNVSLNTTQLEFQKTPGGGRTPDRKLMPGFGVLYSEAFGKLHPFGVTFVANWSRQYRFNDNYQLPSGYSYNQTQLLANNGIATSDMTGNIGAVRWTEIGQADEKKMASLKLEFKPSDSTQFYIETSVINNQGLGGYNHDVRLNAGSQDADSDFLNMKSSAGANIGVTTSVYNNNLSGFSVNPGAKHRFGDLEIAYDGYYSKQKYSPDSDRNFYAGYSLDGLGLNVLNISGNATGKIQQTAGLDYTKLANYGSTSSTGLTLGQDWTYGTDEQAGGKIDIKKPFTVFGIPMKVQMGARYNEATRDLNRHYRQYNLTGDSTKNAWNLASKPGLLQFADRYFSNQWDFSVPVAQWVSPYLVHDYYDAHPNQFYNTVNDETGQYYRENGGKRGTKEAISGLYFMDTVQLLKNLTFLGGVRYELTKLEAKGMQYESPDSDKIFGAGKKYDTVTPGSPYYGYTDAQKRALLWSPIKGWKSYDNVFPNAQLKYEPLKNLIIRGGYSTNISRPDLANILPGSTIYKTYDLIKMNNPALKPQTGTNYDVKIEYYLPQSGVISVSGFKQEFKNWIGDFVYYMDYDYYGTGNPIPWEVQTKQNLGDGSNQGFELQYKQRLGFIASWLQEFEVNAVYSNADPKAQYPRPVNPVPDPLLAVTQPDVYAQQQDAYQNGPKQIISVPLTNVIKRSASLSLTYNGRLFSATIAGYWRDKFMRAFNSSTLEMTNQASDIRIDTKLTYKITSHWSAYFDWRNITNKQDERHIFDRTGGYFKSGMVINLGIRADL